MFLTGIDMLRIGRRAWDVALTSINGELVLQPGVQMISFGAEWNRTYRPDVQTLPAYATISIA